MRIQSLANAGLLIEAGGVRLLCDPWFTDGAYQGAWAIWPRPLKNPVQDIGKVDAIYISHIHPDHYDQTFLRQYLKQWGYTPILCGLWSLYEALQADGFASARYLTMCDFSERTQIIIVPNTTYRAPFDTALAVRCGDESLINMNDNPTDSLIPDGELVYDDEQMKGLLDFCGGSPTVAYLPFTGASSYPQRFTFPSEEALLKAAEEKKQRYLTRFQKMAQQVNSKYVIPFAGEYWLQGPLQQYNAKRGMADATEAASLVKNALVPAAGAWFDTDTGTATAVRTKPYDPVEAMREINARGFTGYECDKHHPGEIPINMKDLYPSSPRLELNENYLLGLFGGRYHWNDALISSHVGILDPVESLTNDMFEALEEWHL